MPNPRIRSVKPRFWDNLKVSKLTRDARLLYIGLQTFADDLGVIIGDSLWLKSRVFPLDEIEAKTFKKWIDELQTFGFITPLSHDGEEFYYLPNFKGEQVINRPQLQDVYIPNGLLNTLLDSSQTSSLSNHGTILDDSRSGEERRGEEGRGEEGRGSAVAPPPTPTKEEIIFERFQKFLRDEAPEVLKLKWQLKEKELTKLLQDYSPDQIQEMCRQMSNYKKLLTTYTSVNLTIRKWLKKDSENEKSTTTSSNVGF